MASVEDKGRLIKRKELPKRQFPPFYECFLTLHDTLRKLMRVEPCGNRLGDAL